MWTRSGILKEAFLHKVEGGKMAVTDKRAQWGAASDVDKQFPHAHLL